MPFRTFIRFVMMAKRQGYFVTRQHMIKAGFSLADISSVLSARLLMLGAEFQRQKEEKKQKEYIMPSLQFAE